MTRSKIEWTERTWNPVTGCTPTSQGCQHCYARRFAERFRGVPGHHYEQGFDLRLWPERLEQPLSWKKPCMVFVNSMSDTFQPNVPREFIRQIYTAMTEASQHTFQVLTKRSDRMVRLSSNLPLPPNVWLGVTIENSDYLHRIDDLRSTDAAIRFLSLEPLLGPLTDLDVTGIDWVIVGGESGPGARSMNPGWVRDIRGQCIDEGLPFFFKQWGGVNKKKAGRILDGRVWNEMPTIPLQILTNVGG